jgi:ABC-2 type transport system ATP-binding protein
LNLIDIFHVMKAYGSFQAVDDVSFSVKKGEVFSLLGPNGAGKTTLIEIEGVRKKDSGDMKVLGCVESYLSTLSS